MSDEYWKRDKYVQGRQRENANSLDNARQNYEAVANERLQNIAKGEWSPWLAIKQNVIEHAQLMPAERSAPNAPSSGYATGYSEDRASRWEQAVQRAQALAEKGGGSPKKFNAR